MHAVSLLGNLFAVVRTNAGETQLQSGKGALPACYDYLSRVKEPKMSQNRVASISASRSETADE